MSGDYHSIQEIGGAELARHYPDRGQIHDSEWYNAILKVETMTTGLRGWLTRLSIGNQAFGAVLSADTDGLRILVALDKFAVFIPWREATVFAARAWPATVVRVSTACVPTLDLLFHLDDAAADRLFCGTVPPLPQRSPPRRLAWWLAQWWVAWAVVILGVGAGLIGALILL